MSRVNTQNLDNELIETNRELAKLLQETIQEQKENIDLTNVKAISGTLKDIEAIANPQNSKVDITNNTQQNNTE